MTVTIVGLGLIGGSAARDLARTGTAATLIGVETDPEHARMATQLGLVDQLLPLDEAVAAADLVLLATPVDAILRILPQVLDRLHERQTVVDMGSTKQAVVEAVRSHPRRARFVAAHPMAGTENAGPDASMERLFDGRIAILCDAADSAPDALAVAERLFTVGLGMRLVRMESARHDLHAAYISHLSHVVSYALALATLDKERDDHTLFSLAGGGFASTVRLAKSGADMWAPIFKQNRANLLDAIGAYRKHLDDFYEAVAADDSERLRALITDANRIRTILP